MVRGLQGVDTGEDGSKVQVDRVFQPANAGVDAVYSSTQCDDRGGRSKGGACTDGFGSRREGGLVRMSGRG